MNPEEVKTVPEPAAQQETLPQAPAELPGRSFWLWGRDMLFSLAVSFFIITFLYQPVRVEGTSMLPRLGDQDRLFINKFVYHFAEIHRGDVVVFHYPRDPQKSYIKRVIAVPGDELRIDDGRTYINGRLLPEPYVPQKVSRQPIAGCDGDSARSVFRHGRSSLDFQ